MDQSSDSQVMTVDHVRAAKGVDPDLADRQLAELLLDIRKVKMANEVREVVSLTVRNSASGALVRKHLDLSRTVREILLFDSLNLFPEVLSATYRVLDYVVTHVRTGRRLDHTETLQFAGVRENDTLEITSPRLQAGT